MTSASRTAWLWRLERRGSLRSGLTGRHSPLRSLTTLRVVFCSVTPTSTSHRPPHAARRLPAPARRRRGELPARVGRARTARPPLLHRLAARGSSASRRPRRSTCRSSATSRTTTSRSSSRRCRFPRTAATCPRAASSSRRRSSASTTAAARREVLVGDRGRDRAPARGRPCVSETQALAGRGAGAEPLPRAAAYEDGVRRIKELIRAGDAFQVVLSPARGAADLRDRARALPRAAAGQPVAVPLPARARRARADRLLAGDARQVRGRSREPEPDRRHDPSRRRRRRAAARLGQGPRRARDARRPRPQRPLARLHARQRAGRALPRAGALLARHPPRLRGDRRAAARRDAVRPPPRLLPGRHGLRRAEGARDADRLGARGLPARPVRGRRRLRAAGRHDGHVHRDPDDRPPRRRRAAPGGRGDRGRLRSGRRAPRSA